MCWWENAEKLPGIEDWLWEVLEGSLQRESGKRGSIEHISYFFKWRGFLAIINMPIMEMGKRKWRRSPVWGGGIRW